MRQSYMNAIFLFKYLINIQVFLYFVKIFYSLIGFLIVLKARLAMM